MKSLWITVFKTDAEVIVLAPCSKQVANDLC